jgi:hypothetical protein
MLNKTFIYDPPENPLPLGGGMNGGQILSFNLLII